MKCPKCKDHELKKRGYDSPVHCKKCGGMWLEFDKIPRFTESLSSSSVDGNEINLNDEKNGLCPSGHGIMVRAKVDADEPFFLEKCGACGGIWFDSGEWQRVANSNLTEKLNEFWCASWQARQRKEKGRQRYLDANRQFLGEELFDSLMKLSETLKNHPEKGRALALLQHEALK